MTDIDVAALRAAAEDQAAEIAKQATTEVNVTGVRLGSRYHPVTSPAVVLDLLDEVERLRSYVAAVRTLPRWLEENGLDDQTVNFVAVNIEGMTNS